MFPVIFILSFFRIQESYLLKHLPVSDFPVIMQLRIIFYAKKISPTDADKFSTSAVRSQFLILIRNQTDKPGYVIG